MKQPNLSARMGGKVVVGRCVRYLAATKPFSQDWGKVIVERCLRYLEDSRSNQTYQPGLNNVVVGWRFCYLEATKPVSQDWGTFVKLFACLGKLCKSHGNKTKNLVRITGVKDSSNPKAEA